MKALKIILWTIGGILALILIALFAGLLLLQHDQNFRASLLRRVEQSLGESTGANLSIRDFKLSMGGLRLDLYGIVVRGTEPASARPLLAADHVGVGLQIDSLLAQKWHLSNLIIDHPVAGLLVNSAGENNLPKPKTQNQSQTGIFDLAIRHAAIHRGEIYYNDVKTPLDAELRDVELGANFDPAQARYFGGLHYTNGLIQYGAYAPVTHNLDARFELTAQNFKMDRLLLEFGGSRLLLNVSVDDYANSPRAQAGYDAVLSTADAARILKDPTLPRGVVRLAGTLNYQNHPNRPLLETMNVTGTVSSAELQVSSQSVRTVIRDLRARYTLVNGNALVDDLHAAVLGGVVNGNAAVRDLTRTQQGRFQASLQGVSLDQLQLLYHSQPLEQARLSGRVNANTQGSWKASIKNLIAHADATIQAHIGQNPPTPLNGVVNADYTGATQQIALHQSYIRTPQTSINFDGRVSTNSQLQVRVASGNLHELELLAANFRPAAPQEQSGELGLYGTAQLNASVAGSLSNPQITGRVQAENLRVKGSAWKLLRADIRANPSSAALENGELQSARQGRFSFNLQVGLTHWSYSDSAPLNINLSGSQLSMEELEELAGQNYPVTGTLSLNVSIHGSQANPLGQGKITLANAVVSNEPIQNVSLNFQGSGSSVTGAFKAHSPAGSAQADFTVEPKTRAFQFQFHADNIRLEQLQNVKERNMQILGDLNLDVSGRGTMDSPELDATLAIPQLQAHGQTLRGLKLQASVRDQVANIALDSEVAQTFIKGRGKVGIKPPYNADVTLDTGRIEFQPLVALYSPEQAENIGGETEMHVTVRGPLQEKTRVEAHLDIPTLTASYKEVHVASARPIRVDYANDTAVLQPATLQGTGTNINLQGSVPLNSPNTASLTMKGTIDLQVAELLVPDVRTGGQIQFDIDSRASGGTAGQVRIVDASINPEDVPISLDHANGVIQVSPARLDVGSFQAQMSGGTLSAKGGVSLRPSVEFGLGLEGHNVRLRYPDGIRALLSATLSLSGTPHASTLGGQVKIQRVSFTPDFDLSTFIGQFNGPASAPAATGSFTDNMRLNIAVQSTSEMNLQSSQVSIAGDANLRVVGTAADPVVLGRTDLTSGELFFAGNRYVIQEGTIDFLNSVTTEPVVNLQVQTKINDYTINIGLQGPLSRLHTTYTSDPALPPADIINLIARGHTIESQGAQPTESLPLGAESLAASAVSNQVGSKIAKVAGISQLQIDPSLGASDSQNPGARIAIQQRVTSSLFVTFATDVTSTQREAIEIEYQLNPRWSVSGVRDQNGGFTGQAYFKKKF